MKKLFLIMASAGFMLSCTKPVRESPSYAASADSLLAKHPRFSGVVLAATGGRIIYHKAVGFRDYHRQVPLDTSDIFELASLSKPFTAVTIMLLKEEGKLSFDDDITRYLPELPYPGITVRHLLTHTSGLPNYQAIMDQYWDKSKVAGNRNIIEYLVRYRPPVHFAPGSAYEYSNTGYVLLASIAEVVSEMDFIDFCRKNIFHPLGMRSTDIRSLDEKKGLDHFALGHVFVEGRQRFVHADSFPASNYTLWLGNRKGPGRVSATAADLFRFDQALYTARLLPPSSLSEAFTASSAGNYGFGWMIGDDPDHGKVVYHTGDNPGYRTFFIRYPDLRKTLVVLNNNDYEAIDLVRKELAAMLLRQNTGS